MLAAQRDKIVRINLESNTMDPLPILNLKNVIAIDFDMRNNCVYWADIVTDTIGVSNNFIWTNLVIVLHSS